MKRYLLNAAASLLLVRVAQFADQPKKPPEKAKENSPSALCSGRKSVTEHWVLDHAKSKAKKTPPAIPFELTRLNNIIVADVDMSGYGDIPEPFRLSAFQPIRDRIENEVRRILDSCNTGDLTQPVLRPPDYIQVTPHWKKPQPEAPPGVK